MFIGIPTGQWTLGNPTLPKILGTTDGFCDKLLDKSPGHVIMDVLAKRTRLLEIRLIWNYNKEIFSLSVSACLSLSVYLFIYLFASLHPLFDKKNQDQIQRNKLERISCKSNFQSSHWKHIAYSRFYSSYLLTLYWLCEVTSYDSTVYWFFNNSV